MARPSKSNPTGAQKKPKQTPEVLATLKLAVAQGATYTQACILAGIGDTTFSQWRAQDPELAAEFERLRQAPVLKAKKIIIDSMEDDPRVAQWYLSRKCRDEFGDAQKVEMSGNVTTSINTEEYVKARSQMLESDDC